MGAHGAAARPREPQGRRRGRRPCLLVPAQGEEGRRTGRGGAARAHRFRRQGCARSAAQVRRRLRRQPRRVARLGRKRRAQSHHRPRHDAGAAAPCPHTPAGRGLVDDLARRAHGPPRNRALAARLGGGAAADDARLARASAGARRRARLAAHEGREEGDRGLLRGCPAAREREAGDGDVSRRRLAYRARRGAHERRAGGGE